MGAVLSARNHSYFLRGSWRKTNISTNATTRPLTNPGVLHSIVINTAGASSNTISVYDDDDGTSDIFATIDGTAAAGSVFLFDCELTTGLTIVTATGTAANITVMWAEG